MKTNRRLCPVLRSSSLCAALAVFAIAEATGRGCAIFVLSSTNSALFCNNEDWSDPKTRVWFVPGMGKRTELCMPPMSKSRVRQALLRDEDLGK